VYIHMGGGVVAHAWSAHNIYFVIFQTRSDRAVAGGTASQPNSHQLLAWLY